MSDGGPAPSGPVELGNLEANLMFLEASGLLLPGMRILEIGSGRGSLLADLRRRGLAATGVETSPARVAEALARHPDLPIQVVEGTTLPFSNETFDLVLSFDVLEHIPDTDAHLAEVRRVLKAGGWYLLQTPNKWTNAVFETIRWRSVTRWQADHCSLHTSRQLDRRLRQRGFDPQFADVPVVTEFYREKVRRHLGLLGVAALRLANPDRLPVRWRTNFYVRARKR